MTRVALSWSSGKDSAWALHLLRQDPAIEVVALVTTIDEQSNRVPMHGVRRELVELQAQSVGLPLWTVPLPWPCSNEEYESRMSALCNRALRTNIDAMAFGDLFLADIRAYRERQLRGTALQVLFPLWQIPTATLAQEMIAAGLKAKISCVDLKVLGPEFTGREFDRRFLNDLPTTSDPCGENGEFHSFVYDGPGFASTVRVSLGEVSQHDGFVFVELGEGLPTRTLW